MSDFYMTKRTLLVAIFILVVVLLVKSLMPSRCQQLLHQVGKGLYALLVAVNEM